MAREVVRLVRRSLRRDSGCDVLALLEDGHVLEWWESDNGREGTPAKFREGRIGNDPDHYADILAKSGWRRGYSCRREAPGTKP